MVEAAACFLGTGTSVRSTNRPFTLIRPEFIQDVQDLHVVRASEWTCDMMGCATSQASLLKGTSRCGETAQTEL